MLSHSCRAPCPLTHPGDAIVTLGPDQHVDDGHVVATCSELQRALPRLKKEGRGVRDKSFLLSTVDPTLSSADSGEPFYYARCTLPVGFDCLRESVLMDQLTGKWNKNCLYCIWLRYMIAVIDINNNTHRRMLMVLWDSFWWLHDHDWPAYLLTCFKTSSASQKNLDYFQVPRLHTYVQGSLHPLKYKNFSWTNRKKKTRLLWYW